MTDQLRVPRSTWNDTTMGLTLLAVGLAVLVSLVVKLHAQLLPAGLASQVGHNSESFAFVVGMAAVVHFVRPWWRDLSVPAIGSLGVGAAFVLAAVAVYYLDTPTSVRTLNEPLLAVGILCGYTGLPRPLRFPWALPLAVVVFVVVLFPTTFVRQQAECTVAVVLAMIAFDLIDRSMLDPAAQATRWLPLWCLFLLVWPAMMLGLNGGDPSGWVGDAIEYQARGAEAFWGVLMLHGYFWLVRARRIPKMR